MLYDLVGIGSSVREEMVSSWLHDIAGVALQPWYHTSMWQQHLALTYLCLAFPSCKL